MLSRRNIRVKVMQTLYSLESMNNETRVGEPLQILQKKLEQSRVLFAYLIAYITEVALFAEKDAIKKAGKYLPTESDLTTSTKIAGNEIIWAGLENLSLKKAINDHKINYLIDEEMIKKSYSVLTKSETYKEYISLLSRDKKSERKILEYIFAHLMIENEDFINDVEEKFIHWDDDAEGIILLMSQFFQKPATFQLNDLIGEEKTKFANELLQTVIEKSDYCLDIITPKLKNWDPERIAALDMILLKMGVCEFLYFETIPVRVTINEYIDLGKEYSTEQSGQFINGILDNISKDLTAQNKIHKRNFKNSTL